jgi:hypothetical protein
MYRFFCLAFSIHKQKYYQNVKFLIIHVITFSFFVTLRPQTEI